MTLQAVLDWIYIPRRRALALGFTHEGWRAGVPVWCFFETRQQGGIVACAKVGALELVISLGTLAVQFANEMRAPGDELQEFAFLIKPIEAGVKL